MIIRNGHELVARRMGSKVAQAVYMGLRLVWMAVRSCFGSGIWISEKPWLGDETWKNNN